MQQVFDFKRLAGFDTLKFDQKMLLVHFDVYSVTVFDTIGNNGNNA